MMRLLFYLLSISLFFAIGCNGRGESVEFDYLAKYRDTLIGNFDGLEIDTLIAEPIDTTKSRNLWSWRVYGKKNTVDTLILFSRCNVRMIGEGDLDGIGTDEFGIRREIEAGAWDNYYVYTYKEGKWEFFIEPIWTYSNHFYKDLKNAKDVVERADKSGFVKVRFSDVRNDEFCIIDTVINI